MKLLFLLGGLFAFFLAGMYYLGNKVVTKKGYENTYDFASSIAGNVSGAFNANYETIELQINEDDIAFMRLKREEALARGLMTNEGDNYVKSIIKYKGKEYSVNLRLKGHMTDHLQPKKWSFRVKTKKGKGIKNMSRFTLQHPGTRGYVYEWIYHKLAEKEGLMHLNYEFVKVKVNNEDWGIYALEENFSPELIENNSKKEGVFIRFSPELYWKGRIDENDRVMYAQTGIAFESSYPEALDKGNVFKNEDRKKQYLRGAFLLEQFRKGSLKAKQVFDIEKLAKLHAIIDLVGGHHSIDWSDVKYFYNAEKDIIEPVAYESFSVRETRVIAGHNKYVSSQKGPKNFHQILFSDEDFFRAYTKELLKVSSPQYLVEFLKEIKPELEEKSRILNKEFWYKRFNPELYVKNQKNIKGILNSNQGIRAYFNQAKDNELKLSVANLEMLPIEIVQVKINGFKQEISPIVLPIKAPNQYGTFNDYKIPFSGEKVKKIEVKCQILGSDIADWKEVFMYLPTELISTENLNEVEAKLKHDNVVVDTINNNIVLISGQIKSDVLVPEGYIVQVVGGTKIDFVNGAKFISYSPVNLIGEEERQVEIYSSDSSFQGFEFHSEKVSQLKYLKASGVNIDSDFIKVRNGCLSIFKSSFINIKTDDLFNVKFAELILKKSLIQNVSGTGVKAEKSKIILAESSINTISKSAIKAGDCKLVVNVSSIAKAKTGIKLENQSILNGNFIINKCQTAISVKEGSKVDLKTLSIKKSETGIKGVSEKEGAGTTSIKIKSLITKEVIERFNVDNKTIFEVNEN